MIKGIYVGIVVSMFLISGFASIANIYADNDSYVIIVNEDLIEGDFDIQDPEELKSHSTRAIDANLYDINWEEMANDRIYVGGRTIQSADLDNDGLLDIVDGTYRGLYVSLQNTDGTWSTMNNGLPTQISANPDIYSLDICDINNDGWNDIVSINYSTSIPQTPDIYLNNMGIDWQHQTGLGFDSVEGSRAIVACDFNSDAILDVAYLGYGPDILLIYVQSPLGTWTKTYEDITIDTSFPNSIDSYDFDNDGDMDVIVGGAPGVYVVENVDGLGTTWNVNFVDPPSVSSYIVSVVCGDLNHDGYVDIVCGVYVSSARNIIIMSYNGTSWNEKLGNLPYFGEYVDFSINDLNLDGHQDIVASGGGGADVFLGNSDYNWTLLNQGLSSLSDANFVADIDNNGILDIVDTDGIYETKGLENLFVKGFETIPSNLPQGEKFALDYGDLNNDGLLDLLAIRESGVVSNSMVVYYNNGDGTWNFYGISQVSIGDMKDGEVGDMDNDGDLDIVFCSQRWNQNIYLLRNAGDGTFPNPPENLYSLPNPDPTPPFNAGRTFSVNLGDYDLDGDLDILAAAQNDTETPPPDPYEIWLIRNDGGSWTNETLYHSTDNIYDAEFVHINNDAYLDIVSVGYSGYGIHALLYDNSTNTWIETANLSTTATARGADFGDINNDGVIEIMAGMKIYSYEDSTESWTLIKDFTQNCRDSVFIDLNFDGLIDVIQMRESWQGGGFTVWTNKGNNIWDQGVYQNLDEDFFQVFCAFDFDWDGTKELFFSSPDIGIRVYEVNVEQDKSEVVFSNAQPSSDEWLDSLTISPSVTISDIEGSGVDANSVYYAVSTTGLGSFGSWIPYPSPPRDAQEIEASLSNILFAEGDQNYIKWRAMDVVGNGYTESPAYQLLIDVSNPYFQNENPQTGSWVNSASQTLSVEITDDWSGLDAPSIYYKLDTGAGYGEWVSAGKTTDGNTLVPSMVAFLSEGTNKIIWIVTDNVGFRVTSEEYIIKLDTKPTTFKSPDPEEGQWMTTSSFICSVNIFDSGINGSGVNSTNIQYRYSTTGVFEYGPWIGATDYYEVKDGQQTGVHVNTSIIPFEEGTNNYVQFQALDLATNGFTPSPDYQILIDTTPITFTTPLPGSDDWQASHEVVCYITIEDIGGSTVDGTSAEFWVVKDNPNPDLVKPNWTKAVTQISAESVTFDAIVDLPDSVYNWIKWRAKDVAGNGFTESGWNQIKVDSTGISFSNPSPRSDQWQTLTSVDCNIILTIDTDSNHLDYSKPESLQYRYSTSGVLGFGPWNDVTDYTIRDATTLTCQATFTLLDGTENYVQWRAIENVSEDYTESAAYQIKVDSTPVTFTNPQPQSNEWQSSGEVVCYITIEDMGGSGVDGTSAEYWVVKDNPLPDSVSPNWTKAVTQISAQSVTFSEIAEFPDGIYNWIKWRAKDVAGNGFSESGWFQIRVDSTDIYFSTPTPGPSDWRISTQITAKIVITIDTDPNHLDYSNPGSLQYRYSTTGIFDLGPWNDANDYTIIDATSLICQTTLDLVDGTDNYIQWRAKENVSVIYSESAPYQINIDTQPITYNNPKPQPHEWQSSNEVVCYITIEDIDGSGVDGSSTEYWVVRGNPDPDSESANWTKPLTQIDGESVTFSITVEIPDGIYNWVKWRAKDVAGNGYTESPWSQIKVDSTLIEFSNPDPGSDEWQTSPSVTASILVTIDTDSEHLDYSNPQALQYRYSTSGVLGYGSWREVDGFSVIDNTTLVCEAFLSLAEGTNNYIQYRALENVSKGIYSTSSSYQIKVDSTPLTFTNPIPTSNYVNEFLEITCYVTLQDSGSGVDGSSIQFRYSLNGSDDASFTDWNSTVSLPDGHLTTVSILLTLENGDDNYLQWAAKDVAGNGPIYSSKYQIKVYFVDTDGDGVADDDDYDDDNDGVLDTQDEFPLDPTEWQDSDDDGIGDNEDTDDDDDGVDDVDDAFPTNPAEHSDFDGDGIGDNSDSDDDNDGVVDLQDKFPYNNTEWSDTDSDGIGDNTDSDIDDDGYLTGVDAFPQNPAENSDWDGDGTGDNSDSDDDNDGVPDLQDKFPYNNTEWSDTDSDGIGDNTDPDIDDDGYLNENDAFPQNPAENSDWDDDGTGDNSDTDDDNDGILDLQDRFPYNNTEWLDTDSDGIGDNTDSDIDGDGYLNDIDAFPTNPNEWEDFDSDGIGDNTDTDDDNDGVTDLQDKFPYDADEWQDTDSDGVGDNGDDDDDGDGISDTEDAFPTNPAEYSDNDGDGIGDNADSDDDNDGIPDLQDVFPFDPLEWHDSDLDGVGNNADLNDDADSVPDLDDAFPTNPNEWSDIDGDGIGDNTDSDRDGDGFPNANDAFSDDPTEWYDTDSDGIGNNQDSDDDNDGYNDTVDEFPLDKKEWLDFDSDGIGDNSDSDLDGDGYSNTNDAFPNDPTEWVDTDSDEIGNNVDDDDDGDGYSDTVDDYPMNSNEWQDTDLDGIGDNADLDDDNDGALDYDDFAPLDASVQKDPNLIRIWGVEFEVGELIMGLLMAIGAVILGTFAFTRKKRLYSKYKSRMEESTTVSELNEVNSDIKQDMEKEHLTNIQLTMLREQYDDKYMKLRERELEHKLGTLPPRVEESIRGIISDKIITEDEFEGMQRWLSRLKETKDFDSAKKEKVQVVLKDWIDDNIPED
jgi:hypothetical protein